MAVGDLILTNTSLTPEDLDKIAAEVEKDLAANAKDPGQWEQVDSLEGVTSLPVFQVIGATYKLVRVAVSLLKGLDGTNGVDGREVELQVSSTAIQWRYSGTTGWTDLIQLSELKGEKGDKGDTGDTGDKGDQIVLRKTSTAIQWKYDSEEDTAYRDLILLADIKGDKGDTGNTPILETVEVTNGETPSGTFTKTGDDESGNPKYKLSLVVQKGKDGQPPIFEQGTTTTVSPDTEASVEVVANGTSEEGNPKYVLNFSIPKGRDGQDGQGSGNVYIEPTGLLASKKYLFQPSQNNSANGTFVEYVEPNNFPDAPKDGKTYGRNNGSWVETSQMDEAPSDGNAYARKNKGWTKVIESTETALLDNYAKLASYSSIEPTDSINEAIGKLEAGIGNQGGGTSSGVYLLNSKLLSLKSTSTSEEIIEAFGGLEETAKVSQAIIDGKQFFIQKKTSSFDKSMTPVSVYGYLNSIIYLSFIYKTITNERIFNIVVAPSSSIKITEIGGYKLKSELYSLTAESSSDDISVAIGGEDGMKEIIKAIKDGNTFFIEGTLGEAKMKTQILPNMCSESENGDLQVTLTGFGYAMWEGLGGLLLIAYNKASNTFSIQIASITS